MAAISSLMKLVDNCSNIIGVESDEEHFSENQISISSFITEIRPFKNKLSLIIQIGRHFFIDEFI